MMTQIWKSAIGVIAALCFLCQPVRAANIYTSLLLVDCSGTDTTWYPSINAALPFATTGTYIYVKAGTTCREDVVIDHLSTIALTTSLPQTFNLIGSLAVGESRSIYIGGMNVSNSHFDGIAVSHSDDISIDSCSSSYNPVNGISIGNDSSVSIGGTGSFSNNGASGMIVSQNSTLELLATSPAHLDISNNLYDGITVDHSYFFNLGNTSISNNAGYGIVARGGASGQLYAVFGPNVIAANQTGGILVIELSELSMGGNTGWAPYQSLIQGNGPVGILGQFGGQVTIIGGTQIIDHTAAGIDIYGNSQLAVYGENQITHNGYGTDSPRAGMRVDGNSQAYIRGATITQNSGPGVLGLANSSLDVAGSTFGSNGGGPITCDTSAVLSTDMPAGSLGNTNSCKISGNSGIQRRLPSNVQVPNWRQQKAAVDKVRAFTSNLHF